MVDLVSFEFLEGEYYNYNEKPYRYNDLTQFKAIIDELSGYLYSSSLSSKEFSDIVFEVREVFIAMVNILEESDPKAIGVMIKNYFVDILSEYKKVINNFEVDSDVNKLRLGVAHIDNALMQIIENDFSRLEKHHLISYLARRVIDFRSDYTNILNDNFKLKGDADYAYKELENYKNSKKNKPAVQLYHEINQDFLRLEKRYRWLFISAIISTLVLTIGYDPLLGIGGNIHSLGCSLNKSWISDCASLNKTSLYPFNGDTLKFLMFKLTVLIVGVTLTTYFLRLSGFYQLKQEQAKQTKLELSAFPDFVSGMDPSVANNLRQELALKYFGKEIDKTMIEKNGDLFQEQIKAGTELIKASAEMVKTVKPSTAKEEDSEAKDKNKTE